MPRTPLEPSRFRERAPGGAAITAVTVLLIGLSAAAGVACRADDASAPSAPESTPAQAAAPTRSSSPSSSPQASVLVAQAPAGTSAAEAPSSAPPKPGSHAELAARLDRMLKAAQDCSSSDECRSVPVGGKACGGPTGYRAYSTKGADPQTVEALAREEHEAAMAEARASGRVSNCMILADPGAACVQGKCTTGGPAAPRGAVSR